MARLCRWMSCFLALSLAMAARAEAPRPGLWQLELASRAAMAPEVEPLPETESVCLSERELLRPESLFLRSGLLAHLACRFGERKETGSRIEAELDCPGGLRATGRALLATGPERITGTLTVHFAAAPKSGLQRRLAAEYRGRCPEPGMVFDLP